MFYDFNGHLSANQRREFPIGSSASKVQLLNRPDDFKISKISNILTDLPQQHTSLALLKRWQTCKMDFFLCYGRKDKCLKGFRGRKVDGNKRRSSSESSEETRSEELIEWRDRMTGGGWRMIGKQRKIIPGRGEKRWRMANKRRGGQWWGGKVRGEEKNNKEEGRRDACWREEKRRLMINRGEEAKDEELRWERKGEWHEGEDGGDEWHIKGGWRGGAARMSQKERKKKRKWNDKMTRRGEGKS